MLISLFTKSTCRPSMSKPTKFLSRLTQALAVVPLPLNGSRTKSPFLVELLINTSKSRTGFSVGFIKPYLSLRLFGGMGKLNKSEVPHSLIGLSFAFSKEQDELHLPHIICAANLALFIPYQHLHKMKT